jgi:signal peptidase II
MYTGQTFLAGSDCVILLLVSAAVLLLCDQWSKKTVRLYAPDRCVSFGSFLRIRYVTNLNHIYQRNQGRTALFVIWFVAFLSAIILRHYGGWFHSQGALIGLGLAFGGAAGNLLDILRYKYVVDFVDLGWWPVFNFADVGIVGGLAFALWR